jgi:hypothetical protein
MAPFCERSTRKSHEFVLYFNGFFLLFFLNSLTSLSVFGF